MKKTLRKKFILFAMSAVTILLVVIIVAISGFSWIILDRQSDNILHMITGGEETSHQMEERAPRPFAPRMNMDTIKSARFFTVLTDEDGNVIDVNLEQIASVNASEAEQYAMQITGESGKIDGYKYEVKQITHGRLIFFMDTANQLNTFWMILCITVVIALLCWLLLLLFVILYSGHVVRPIAAGMEKQKQFITNAGHELKTPLAIIQSNNDAATLLYGENKYSRNIRSQIRRLNVLMTNLLTLAKLDEETRLPTEPVDISGLTEGMFAGYEDIISEKNIRFTSDLEPGITLQVHRETFSQMISVLLDNATRYTPENGTIHFLLKKENGQVLLREENTCEMPSDPDPERLFERFYRGDSARTQKQSSAGYGIGLSAARAIAETFGGSLTADYPENGKIRFTAGFRV